MRQDDPDPSDAAFCPGIDAVQQMLGDRRIVLEGGSIDVNGCGEMLTTEEGLLSDITASTPGLTLTEREQGVRE